MDDVSELRHQSLVETDTTNVGILTHDDTPASDDTSSGLPILVPTHDEPTNDFACSIEVRSALLNYPVGPFHRGSLKSTIMGMFGFKEARAVQEWVPALKFLTLKIHHGERVGIIGQNGSGKSSLLRAIGGIYPLASGTITVNGRIGTLLDVSLGFETESTGRENIYNRGYAMGLNRKQLIEIEKDIVDFANIGEFIDLPMRTYSTGMFVRLGFAISTQLTPDILLIDEVFSAGDARFARKAEKRLNKIADQAGIVVMVSHDFAAIEKNCDRVIWIHEGRIRMDGEASKVISMYLKAAEAD